MSNTKIKKSVVQSVENCMPPRCEGHYQVVPGGMIIYFGGEGLEYRVNIYTRQVLRLPFSAVPEFATRGVPRWAYRLLKTGKIVQIARSIKPFVTKDLPPSVRQGVPKIPDVVAKSSLEPDQIMTYACRVGGKTITLVFLKDDSPANSIPYHTNNEGVVRRLSFSKGQSYSLSVLDGLPAWKKGRLSDFPKICEVLLLQEAQAA